MDPAVDPAVTEGTPYDLLLRGGEVVDPESGLRGSLDVAFAAGRVAAIAPGLDPGLSRRVVSVAGALVTPGLIDIHVHAVAGLGMAADPDVAGVGRGATTVVDAGTCGAATFGLIERLNANCRTRVLVWLSLSSVGQVDTRVGEFTQLPWLDVDRAVETARANPDVVVGFKARLSNYAAGGSALPALRLLLEAGEAAGLPVLVHVGDTGEPLGRILDRLRPGDVVSHYLTGRRHGILGPSPLAGAKIIPEAFEARRRGVLFDVAPGRAHIAFPVVEAALAAGLLPDTLSTDLTRPGAADPRLSLSGIATQFLSFGVPLDDLLPRVTVRPARAIHRADLGRLRIGGVGDATVLRIEDGEFAVADSDGRWRASPRRIVAVGTVQSGSYAPVDGGREMDSPRNRR
jgi:dihydroorotase